MSTNAISGTTPTTTLSSLLSVTQTSLSNAATTHSDSTSAATGPAQGGIGKLFSALLIALEQFVTDHPARPAAPATTGTPTTASSTPATTGTTPTGTASTASTTTATGSTTAATSSTVTTTTGTSRLSQDLQSFLHDLFGALRQEARVHGGHGHEHEDRHDDDDDSRSPSTTTSTPAGTTNIAAAADRSTTPITTTSTGSITTPITPTPIAPPITPPIVTPSTTNTAATDTGATAPAATPTATAPASATATVASSPIGQYGRHGIAAELAALIQSLSNSPVVSSPSTASGTESGLSSSTLSNLNSAFTKLIGDLGGTTAVSSTPAASTAAATGTSATSTSATASTPATGYAALQSFLTSLLQDLQGTAAGSTGSPSPLGNSVNVTA